ncbi:MAG TPA: Xaa-Pro aminopeptidase [Candidatus Saccharimonadales bacterium]
MQNNFFLSNRKSLSQSLKGGMIVLSAYASLQRQNDAAYKFQQEANFWYLTGIEQAEWRVIIDGATGEEWLVKPDIDEVHEIFDGSLSAKRASEISGIKKVISHDEGIALLRLLAKKHSVVNTVDNPPYADQFGFVLNQAIAANKKMLERTFASVVDCQKELAKLRAIKQPEEIKAIQRAIAFTMDGFQKVKDSMSSARHEYELEAEFTYYFKRTGGFDHAYDPIVASGGNACTLHYGENSSKLQAKQFVLMDVGARVDGYAADITRTYIKGSPTKRQKEVHQAVQAAHFDIIQLLTPGLPVEEYSQKVDIRMKQALIDIGLLKDEDDTETYRKYFPHAISHGLGIDVHDSLGGTRYFEPGMVLTVEPGIYIPEENIGVRIEDDILITSGGHKNLSAELSTEW